MKMMTCREASQAMLAEHALRITAARIRQGCTSGKYPYMLVGNRVLVDFDAICPLLMTEYADKGLSTSDLAQRIGLSESAIRRAVADGWLPCEKGGRSMRFDLTEVQSAIKKRMNDKFER